MDPCPGLRYEAPRNSRQVPPLPGLVALWIQRRENHFECLFNKSLNLDCTETPAQQVCTGAWDFVCLSTSQVTLLLFFGDPRVNRIKIQTALGATCVCIIAGGSLEKRSKGILIWASIFQKILKQNQIPNPGQQISRPFLYCPSFGKPRGRLHAPNPSLLSVEPFSFSSLKYSDSYSPVLRSRLLKGKFSRVGDEGWRRDDRQESHVDKSCLWNILIFHI